MESRLIPGHLPSHFSAEPGMDMIGIAVHTDGPVTLISASKAEVLLLDCSLPGEAQSNQLIVSTNPK